MGEPVPQRIGDAERDRAAEYLREHLSVGRLTQDEFDERVSAALTARTAAGLEPLFADLPAPKPGNPGAEPGTTWPQYQVPQPSAGAEVAPRARPNPPANSKAVRALTVATAIAWPVWVMFCFAVGWQYWWVVFIPIILSTLADQQRKTQNPTPESPG